MSYHSHKLNSSHSHIIGRTDPITGDCVQENDNVVFCAVCKSCFLEESWVYMNERHCEQSETLDFVPVAYSTIIVNDKENKLIYKLKIYSVYTTIFLCIFYFVILYAITINHSNRSLIFLASIAFGGMAGTFTSFLLKRFTSLGITPIRVFKNRIEIKKEISFWKKEVLFWKDIKQIKFQREVEVYQIQMEQQITSDSSILCIYFNDGKFTKYSLPATNSEQSKKLLEGLEKISHFKEVLFYSESWEELQIMKNIKSQSKGNIEIIKPIKVFDSNAKPIYERLYS